MNIAPIVKNETDLSLYLHSFKTYLEKSNGNSPGVAGLKGEYIDERFFSDFRGVKEKQYYISHEVLRDITRRVSIISSIINVRCSQVRQFSNPAVDDNDTGFQIKIKDIKRTPTKQEEKEIAELTEFFINTGIELPDEDGVLPRETSIDDINEMLTRETLTIDQIAIVPRYNQKGHLIEFRQIDGATIKRIDPKYGYLGDKRIMYVQMLQGEVVETFTKDELIFDFMNRRADIRHSLYGFALSEMAVEVITGFLFANQYNVEHFNTAAQPKGFFSFDGNNIPTMALEELQRSWVAMFSGVKGLWRVPFLQYGAKWNTLNMNNRDMEFNTYIQFLAALICSVYKIDPQELGLRLNQAQNVLSENQESKLVYSKDRGLQDLLFFIQKVYNKIIHKDLRWRDKYRFEFTGIRTIDRQADLEMDVKKVSNYMTINELRATKDLEPLDNCDVILNPSWLQYIQQKEQASQGMDGGGDEFGGGDEETQDEGVDSGEIIDDAMAEFQKSMIEFEVEI